MTKKLKKYVTKELRLAEKYIYKVYEYLKEMENDTYDRKLQMAINNLCEADEIVSNLGICVVVREDE